MEKKIIMVIVAAMAIIASAYTVSSAADSFDRPGVQGLWNRGVQECGSETRATEPQEGLDSLYSSQSPGVQGLTREHQYGIELTQPEKGMDYLDYSGQPAGVQGLWPSKSQVKC